jgi:hypothetical protein
MSHIIRVNKVISIVLCVYSDYILDKRWQYMVTKAARETVQVDGTPR